MSYQISVTKLDQYLLVTVDGIETLDNVVSVWKEVAKACKRHNCRKVLFDGVLRGSGPLADIYDFGKRFNELGMPAGSQIAVLCKEDDLGKLQFAETVVANRALVVTRNFLNKDDAEAWLMRCDFV